MVAPVTFRYKRSGGRHQGKHATFGLDAQHALAVERTPGALAFLASDGEIPAADDVGLRARMASALDFARIAGVKTHLPLGAISLDELHADDGGTSLLNERADDAGAGLATEEEEGGGHGEKRRVVEARAPLKEQYQKPRGAL